MFRLDTGSFLAYGEHLSHAQQMLPQAHVRAASDAIGHLHQAVTTAADQAGLRLGGLLHVQWNGHQPALAIEHSKAGNEVFDSEFGSLNQPASPVIRPAVNAHLDEAQHIYAQRLWQELGL